MAMNARAVALLSSDLLHAIKRHYEANPIQRDSVYEVLNALGVACAIVLAPAAEHGEEELAKARGFLNLAIDNHMVEAAKLGDETPTGGTSVN